MDRFFRIGDLSFVGFEVGSLPRSPQGLVVIRDRQALHFFLQARISKETDLNLIAHLNSFAGEGFKTPRPLAGQIGGLLLLRSLIVFLSS